MDQRELVGVSARPHFADSYWGTTDLGEISDLIYDNLDDFSLGTVQVVNPVAAPIH
jgi:hypothetical protein